jgi:hypothetical protein
MIEKGRGFVQVRPGLPFEDHGAPKLNRRARRAVVSRRRRAGASGDPLMAFLRSKRGTLLVLGGLLLIAMLLWGVNAFLNALGETVARTP